MLFAAALKISKGLRTPQAIRPRELKQMASRDTTGGCWRGTLGEATALERRPSPTKRMKAKGKFRGAHKSLESTTSSAMKTRSRR